MTEIKQIHGIIGKPKYLNAYSCAVCDDWIPNSNIAGNCPHCGSEGFKTLRAEEEARKLRRRRVK